MTAASLFALVAGAASPPVLGKEVAQILGGQLVQLEVGEVDRESGQAELKVSRVFWALSPH